MYTFQVNVSSDHRSCCEEGNYVMSYVKVKHSDSSCVGSAALRLVISDAAYLHFHDLKARQIRLLDSDQMKNSKSSCGCWQQHLQESLVDAACADAFATDKTRTNMPQGVS